MNVVDHKCLSCASPLNFDVKTQRWTCNYCKRIYTLADLSDNINKYEKATVSPVDMFVCNNCGARVIGDKTISSAKCPYCGNSVIIKSNLTGTYKPDAIITFRHTPEEIMKIFSNDLKSKYFSDNDFGNIENIEFVSPIYVPYWLVTCEVMASVKGLKGGGTDKNGQTHPGKICSRLGSMTFNRVPADAKRNLDNELLQGIEPFNYNELIKFEYPYLAGMFAECYDETSEEIIKNQIKQRIEEAAENQLAGDISVHERSTFIKKPLFEYVLVPIWLVKLKYKGKEYNFCINDQTTKVSGIRQINKIKIVFLSSIITFIALALTIIYMNISNDGGYGMYIFLAGMTSEGLIINGIINSYTKIKKGNRSDNYIEEGSIKLLDSNSQDQF